jgi:hypothetical protein
MEDCNVGEKSTNVLWSYLKDGMWGYAKKLKKSEGHQ